MLNKTILIGRLTADPELRYTPNGVAVSNFTLAVDRAYKKDETDFIDCVAWRKAAEALASNMQRGCMVAVDGRLEIDKWETDEGQTRRKAKVQADNIRFITWPDESKEQLDDIEISQDDAPF